jgi:pimeloyl-ACP methyl ester carboxylesterase
MQKIINGKKTNYEVVGSGQPLVIFHGWGSNTERWQAVAEILAENGFKVIIPDLPGFGKSEELVSPWNMNNYLKWAEEFVKELNLQEFDLLGHSFGGALAVKLAIKYPQNVKKLFLVSAASVRKKTTKKSIFKNLAKVVKLFAFVPGYAFFRKAFYKFVIRRSDYPYVSGTMAETFKNVIGEDLSQFTGFLKIPTIIIWGDKDKSTPIEDAHFMNQKIKNSKLVVIEGAGHALNKENPEVLAQKILENV